MTAYATVEELEEYLSADAPSDAERLLNRATEVVKFAAIGVVDATDETTAAALRDATCAQVEQWIETGEDQIISGRIKNTEQSVGNLTVKSTVHMISPRALIILANAGLTKPLFG